MVMMMLVMGMKNLITMILIKNMFLKGGDVLLSLVFNDKHSRSLQISAKHIVYRSLLSLPSLSTG